MLLLLCRGDYLDVVEEAVEEAATVLISPVLEKVAL